MRSNGKIHAIIRANARAVWWQKRADYLQRQWIAFRDRPGGRNPLRPARAGVAFRNSIMGKIQHAHQMVIANRTLSRQIGRTIAGEKRQR